MSCVNIFAEPSRGLIATDAAVYDAEGRLLALHDKVALSPDGSLAVTGRGNAWFSIAVAKALNGWTIDDLEGDGGAFF